jgi:hypothetical protein
MFIDPKYRYEIIVLHELAHGLLLTSDVAPHGPEFMRAWVELVEHQLGWPVSEHLTGLIQEAGRELATDAKLAHAIEGTAQMVRVGREPRKRSRTGVSMLDFEALERSWSWQYDRHLRYFARLIGERSDQRIVSVCRRAGDTEVTMRVLKELLHAHESTEEPPKAVAHRRLARRALVAVGCPEPYLAHLGLEAEACSLSADDVTWEAHARKLIPPAEVPQG